MNKTLTSIQIQTKYHDEWVLLANPDLDRLGRIRKGRVLFHSQDRDTVDSQLLKTHVKNVAIYYAGDTLKDIIL